jgi:hypothetical protein
MAITEPSLHTASILPTLVNGQISGRHVMYKASILDFSMLISSGFCFAGLRNAAYCLYHVTFLNEVFKGLLKVSMWTI